MTLLGIPGDNTYANYQEANRTFWRQVLPKASKKSRAAARQPHRQGPLRLVGTRVYGGQTLRV